MFKRRYLFGILVVLLGLIFLIFFNDFLNYLSSNNNIFSSVNNIESINLSNAKKQYKDNFDKIKFEDKEGINIRFSFNKNKQIDNTILKFDGKINLEKLYLNYNTCDYKNCDSEIYELTLLYNNDLNHYYLINQIDLDLVKLVDSSIYSFWNIGFFNEKNKNVIIEDFSSFSIIKNNILLNLLNLINLLSLLGTMIIKINFFLGFLLVILFFSGYFGLQLIIKKYKNYITNNFLLFYIIIIIIGFFLCLLQLYQSGLNIIYDEYYSWVTIQQSFVDIIKSTMGDVHPPAYYYYLKLNSIIFGNNIIVLKILNIFLLFPIFYFLYKLYFILFKNNYKKVLFISSIFLLLNTYFLMFSSIIRMYFFGIFIFIASSYFLINYLKSIALKKDKKNNLILYILFATIGLYTHNYFIFFNFAQFIYVIYYLFHNRVKKYVIFKIIGSYLIMGLLYLPWFFILLKQSLSVSDDYWIHNLNIVDISQFLINIYTYFHNDVFQQNFFLSNNFFINIIVILIFLFFIYKYYIHNKKNIFAHYNIFIILIPLLFSIFYSIFKTPIFSERYFLIGIIFYISLLSFLKYKKLYFIGFLFFLFFLQNIGIGYLGDYNSHKDIDKNYINIIEKEKPDIIINNNISTLVVFDYLSQQNKYNFINSIYNNNDIKEGNAYNGRSLFYRYNNINNTNLGNIQAKRIIIINFGITYNNIVIPHNWKILKEIKNKKIPYIIYENVLTK